MLDQKTLTSMNVIRAIKGMFSLKAQDQSYLLRISVPSAKHMSPIRNALSKGLDSGVAPEYGNQAAKGLLATYRIQRVGIHRARLTLFDCLRSSQRRKITKPVQSASASLGGKYLSLG